jgi:hypothetical protein
VRLLQWRGDHSARWSAGLLNASSIKRPPPPVPISGPCKLPTFKGGRILADPRSMKQLLDQAHLLASIRQRRSFCPNDYDLPDSLLVLREDRGR